MAGGALLAAPAWAEGTRGPDLGITPGTLVDAQGRPMKAVPGGTSPFVGEIAAFGFNFNPSGWAKCDGQLLNIASNTALFSLLGTTYGGDGESTFGLPDLRGRLPMHQGNGGGLSPRSTGQRGGFETVTLTQNQMPNHSHGVPEVQVRGTGTQLVGVAGGGTQSATENTSAVGGGQAHENMPPFLVINYCIALVGVFPSES